VARSRPCARTSPPTSRAHARGPARPQGDISLGAPRADVGTALSRPAVYDLIGSPRWRRVWQSEIVNCAKRPDRRGLLAAAHPTRRDGAIALVLFLLPWVAAVILVRRHHHLDGGTVGILVAVSLGLPTLWVTWAAYRGPRRSGGPVSGLGMGQIADQLAVAVGTQWTAEAAVRRLNDPYPLPVSWNAADASLTDSWDSMVKLAASGAGSLASSSPEAWATGPYEMAGEGGELVDVLARVPTGRLVVLGEPGSGKTMLMVRLVLDLLGRRATGGPVPFLASVASWDPTAQDLRKWLAVQLLTDHPALASPPPEDRTEPTRAAALLASGLILPILDGLDEIPEQFRGPAISRVNDALRPGEQLVVTCRTEQYQETVRPQNGVEVTLRAAAECLGRAGLQRSRVLPSHARKRGRRLPGCQPGRAAATRDNWRPAPGRRPLRRDPAERPGHVRKHHHRRQDLRRQHRVHRRRGEPVATRPARRARSPFLTTRPPP
jgi:NACHT domain